MKYCPSKELQGGGIKHCRNENIAVDYLIKSILIYKHNQFQFDILNSVRFDIYKTKVLYKKIQSFFNCLHF